MGLRGPKKLSSTELKQRGSRLHLIRQRQKEEQGHRRQETFARTQAPAGAIPEGLTHPTALHFWRETIKQYALDDHAAILVAEAARSLQRAEQARETLDKEGAVYTDKHGKQWVSPLVKIELDHRGLFAKLFRECGFLAE